MGSQRKYRQIAPPTGDAGQSKMRIQVAAESPVADAAESPRNAESLENQESLGNAENPENLKSADAAEGKNILYCFKIFL